MPTNVEIKARIASVAALLPRVRGLAEQGPWEIRQDDTYFGCATGRLKLRVSSAAGGELIYYRRDNQNAPKESFYLRSATSAPDTLRVLLTQAYGEIGRIEKQRTLFLRGRTRIHLDKVRGLGEFLELEVVLAADEPSAVGASEADELLKRLGVEPAQLIAGSYLDLLADSSTPREPPAWAESPVEN
ncbi:MAG TPA: class IV adenylate cyclase [Steroidobacteraceae bacterium]|nr:class IV adenylate cyclase [Steroidobacteraceae bacterium]